MKKKGRMENRRQEGKGGKVIKKKMKGRNIKRTNRGRRNHNIPYKTINRKIGKKSILAFFLLSNT